MKATMRTFKVEKRLYFSNGSETVTLDLSWHSASESERQAVLHAIAEMRAQGFYFSHAIYI